MVAAAPMNEKTLLTALIEVIRQEADAQGVKNVRVLRNYQDVKAARVRNAPQIVVHKLFEYPYARTRRRYKCEKGYFEIETQKIEGTYQVSAVSGGDEIEANDLIRVAVGALQMARGLYALADKGLRPLKVGQVRNQFITDEAANNTAMPNFDIVIVWEHTIERPIAFAEIEGKIIAVEKGRKAQP